MGEGRVGLIAGGGALPREAAAALEAQGLEPLVFGTDGITEPALLERGAALRLGQVDALLRGLRDAGATRALIVGDFDPGHVESPASLFDPDASGRALLAANAGRSPVAWMEALATWLAEQGVELLRQDEALPTLLAREGPLAGRAPDADRLRDLVAGREALAGSPPQALAQAVAVADGRVVATEAKGGTDALIRRAGEAGVPGFTLVKGARPGQDPRLDLPAIGPATISALAEAGAGALAIQAGATLVIDGARVSTDADAAGLVVWGYAAARRSGG